MPCIRRDFYLFLNIDLWQQFEVQDDSPAGVLGMSPILLPSWVLTRG
jgi:hypothetical protein